MFETRKKEISWDCTVANSKEELADIILSAAYALKTQELESEVLKSSGIGELKDEFGRIASHLIALHDDLLLKDWKPSSPRL